MPNVLSDESYTGVLINHQTETHNRTVTDVPKTEQYRHEKYYPVIIQPEEWQQAQALLKANAHIADLYDEILRLEQETDDLLPEKIQSGG